MTWEDVRAWISAGDEVVLDAGPLTGERYRLLRVDRTTPTLIVVGGVKYRRKDGRVVGPGRQTLRAPTQELRREVERSDLIRRFRTVRWGDLSLAYLRRVARALEPLDPLVCPESGAVHAYAPTGDTRPEDGIELEACRDCGAARELPDPGTREALDRLLGQDIARSYRAG